MFGLEIQGLVSREFKGLTTYESVDCGLCVSKEFSGLGLKGCLEVQGTNRGSAGLGSFLPERLSVWMSESKGASPPSEADYRLLAAQRRTALEGRCSSLWPSQGLILRPLLLASSLKTSQTEGLTRTP